MSNRPVHHFFIFTKKERNGIIGLIILFVFIILLPSLYNYCFPDKPTVLPMDAKEYQVLLTHPNGNQATSAHYSNKSTDKKRAVHLFDFDPNTLSVEGWQMLGLSDKTITTIQKYLSKGGRFYKPTDINNIYGLNESLASLLIPHVKIENLISKQAVKKSFFDSRKSTFSHTIIDINLADSAALDKLPGIGAKLSARILSFRNQLGGFYSLDQLGEVYGLVDSVYQKIKSSIVIPNPIPRKMNINTASFDELAAHPYVRYRLAKAIIQFREQHGKYHVIEDIKKIVLIDEGAFNKLVHYFSVE